MRHALKMATRSASLFIFCFCMFLAQNGIVHATPAVTLVNATLKTHEKVLTPVSYDCTQGDVGFDLALQYYTEYYGPYVTCYYGTGYLGVYIDGVRSYQYPDISGWFRGYINGQGFFESFQGGGLAQYFQPTILITQICIECGAVPGSSSGRQG